VTEDCRDDCDIDEDNDFDVSASLAVLTSSLLLLSREVTRFCMPLSARLFVSSIHSSTSPICESTYVQTKEKKKGREGGNNNKSSHKEFDRVSFLSPNTRNETFGLVRPWDDDA
jgi:hypothetical protein